MILITCADDAMGVAFNHRRLSRDRNLTARILERTAGHILWMSPSSAKLFDADAPIRVSDTFLEQAGAGEYCFAETEDLTPWVSKVEQLILYRWNRSYPSDRKLALPLEQWRLCQSTDFPGHSHERLTEEIYCK
jgi:hypothetical protein